MIMQTALSRRFDPFGIWPFARLFERTASACGFAVASREAALKPRPNETRSKTFLYDRRAARHFLEHAPGWPGIELPPGTLENGLLRFISGASEAKVVEIKLEA